MSWKAEKATDGGKQQPAFAAAAVGVAAAVAAAVAARWLLHELLRCIYTVGFLPYNSLN